MQVLGLDNPLLLWGAERPFQIQLLAGLGRLAMDVFALTESAEGKKLVDQLHPKNNSELRIPDEFSGTLIWAPRQELFTNSPLSDPSKKELDDLLQRVGQDPRILKIVLLLPQSALAQLSFSQTNVYQLYFPSVVGFGDENVFDKKLTQILDTGVSGRPLTGDFVSAFDAISFVLSALKNRELPRQLWILGHAINHEALNSGFAEVDEASFLGPLQYALKKLQGKDPQFINHTVTKPDNIPLGMDIFPTVLTPWERFFRDAYRIYQSTQDDRLLLHFRPTRTP